MITPSIVAFIQGSGTFQTIAGRFQPTVCRVMVTVTKLDAGKPVGNLVTRQRNFFERALSSNLIRAS